MYAELSVHYDTLETLEAALLGAAACAPCLALGRGLCRGKAYLLYRRRGGTRRSPLPDFYIGVHAAVAGLALLTCGAKRYREYFPKLKLIAPA